MTEPQIMSTQPDRFDQASLPQLRLPVTLYVSPQIYTR